jgi:hypothetical protein
MTSEERKALEEAVEALGRFVVAGGEVAGMDADEVLRRWRMARSALA